MVTGKVSLPDVKSPGCQPAWLPSTCLDPNFSHCEMKVRPSGLKGPSQISVLKTHGTRPGFAWTLFLMVSEVYLGICRTSEASPEPGGQDDPRGASGKARGSRGSKSS